MPLILSSNVTWDAYRLIAETNIFRIGVSLYVFCIMLTRNKLAKKYITERYNIFLKIPRILRHIYNKWSHFWYFNTNQLHYIYIYITNTITFTVYEYILIFNLIYTIYIYILYYLYYMYYIYISYVSFAFFLFIATTLSQHIHALVTLVSHSRNPFQLVLWF